VATHVRELELEFEVRNGPQPANHDGDAILARKLDSQAGVSQDLDVGQIMQHAASQVHARFQGNRGALLGLAAMATIT